MSTIISSEPLLRFPEFKDKWEFKKGKEIFINRRAKTKNALPIYSVTMDRGLIPRDSLEKRIQQDAPTEDNLVAHPNDIVYNMMRMWQGALGIAYQICMVSPAYVILQPKEGINSEFYALLMKTKQYLYKLESYSYGLTSDRLRLYFKDFSLIAFPVPTPSEQEKISLLFKTINFKIECLSKKKNILEQYKKGVVQQIFSQKIRFKDEYGQDYPEWEDRKLGWFFEERSERGFENEELLAVTISEGVKIRSTIDLKDNSSEDKSNYKRVLKNDIAYNSMRMWQGASGVAPCNGIVSPAYTVLKPTKHAHVQYFGFLFKTTKIINIFQRYSQGLTSDTWNLKYNQLSKISLKTPSIQEQQKIATFIATLDEKINVVQRQIDLTKDYKKSLLQKLFV